MQISLRDFSLKILDKRAQPPGGKLLIRSRQGGLGPGRPGTQSTQAFTVQRKKRKRVAWPSTMRFGRKVSVRRWSQSPGKPNMGQ